MSLLSGQYTNKFERHLLVGTGCKICCDFVFKFRNFTEIKQNNS